MTRAPCRRVMVSPGPTLARRLKGRLGYLKVFDGTERRRRGARPHGWQSASGWAVGQEAERDCEEGSAKPLGEVGGRGRLSASGRGVPASYSKKERAPSPFQRPGAPLWRLSTNASPPWMLFLAGRGPLAETTRNKHRPFPTKSKKPYPSSASRDLKSGQTPPPSQGGRKAAAVFVLSLASASSRHGARPGKGRCR
jgi:hypothetical protein